MKYKSLMIIGVPRSGSTALEIACHKMLEPLGFERDGEIFNPVFYPDLNAEYNTRNKEDFETFKLRCKNRRHNSIVRDVTQHNFIIEYANVLKQWFNIIHIIRPIREVKLCCQLKGWNYNNLAEWSNKLSDIPSGKSMRILSYNDFALLNPDKLYSILRNWYPCEKVDYMTQDFVEKREETFTRLGCHGVVPECVSRRILCKPN